MKSDEINTGKGIFIERMRSYAALPESERIDKMREEVRCIETRILEMVDGRYGGDLLALADHIDDMNTLGILLDERHYALSEMFALHCSDAEAGRIEEQDAYLHGLTDEMFRRTGRVFRHMLDMPRDVNDGDLYVEGTLKFRGDDDVLEMEEDGFYGSDFARLIPVAAFYEREATGDDAFIQCGGECFAGDIRTSSMTDRELGIHNDLDDGTTWAESWLKHPKLEHIVMCYATHAIVTHYIYSVPDYMRMQTFEINVKAEFLKVGQRGGGK